MAALEALLFYHGEPIAFAKAEKILGLKRGEGAALAAALKEKLETDSSRGLVLILRGDGVQLATKPSLRGVGEQLIREEFRETLTPAAQETLSLIAYLGPISRAEVDFTRGVNSSYMVRNLLVRGLIDRKQVPEKGNLYHYEVSFRFLAHLGLTSASLLPEYAKFRETFKGFEAAVGGENPVVPAP